MPHKRAKRSVRDQLRNNKGVDLVPTKQSITNETIPKSVARVLNAAKIREEWRNKKRRSGEDVDKQSNKRRKLEGDGGGGARGKEKARENELISQLIIKPGESIQHFNRRVEDDMRPLVKSAMQSAHAVTRKREIEATAKRKEKGNQTPAKKEEEVAKEHAPRLDKFADRPKDFEKLSSSAPRRLNDVAQAPPEFTKLPRGASSGVQRSFWGGRREGVLSMAQKSVMEKEREKAVARYREMKASWGKHG